MQNSKQRPVLQRGDIGFAMTHNNWISKAISWFMKSKWSHTFVIVEQTDTMTYTSETSDFQVVIGGLEFYLEDEHKSIEIWRPVDVPERMKYKIVQRCLQNTYTLYGYLQLISLGVRRLLMRFGIKINNFFRQGIVCDQNVAYGYALTDIPGMAGMDPESLDTEEFYRLVVGCERNKIKCFKLVYKKEMGEILKVDGACVYWMAD